MILKSIFKKALFLSLISSALINTSHSEELSSSKIENEKQVITNYITNKYNIKNNDARNIVDNVYYYSKEKSLDPTLVLGMIEKESSFNKNAVGNGSIGLMQIIPKYHKPLINNKISKNGGSLKDIDNNIDVGTSILKEKINKYDSISRSLQHYNGNTSTSKYYKKVFHYQNNIKNKIDLII